ncbi:YVTN family beta-propeller protein [Pontibacter ummariensis]|uniref:40-residue YVTN family beta-propeller repeat-containing protein n=1 Tax=Pontibacter ummariensis TaxID=1610492 RepID=A0A239H835_9BACT|nr:DUF5074 domain-containing protein [Pontibacter ummariensis]PRY10715.1 YVTN family beta-propeller protein [Pontibacter ummariensis]SNS77520.1 40-residue YVTN family beta-propeller repeat-containing protein [Pontibacter ummariensis]
MKNLNNFRSLFLAASLAFSAFTFTSCNDDNDGPSGAYAEDGVFVVNEGNFQQSNGSISFYNNNTNQIQQGIFSKENEGRILGDVVQDLTISSDRAFIVVNNSNKVEVVNANTFQSLGTVEGVALPRYFTVLNNDKGYVTEWVSFSSPGRVAVVDLNDYTVTKTIEIGAQPEDLLLVGGKLYVTNNGDNTVSVINTATDAVEATITVPDAPTDLVLDRNNNVWVLSAGKVVYTPDWSAIDYDQTTAGALSLINPSTNTVQASYTFDSNQSQPGNLAINGSGDKLYFTYNGKTFVQDISASSLTNAVFLDRSFYGLDVDPETGYIYGGDAGGFSGNGTVYVYRPDGTQVKTFTAGIAPNGFVFN